MEYIVDSMQSLIDALASSDCTKIILSEDITLVSKINIVNDVVIDLNQHTINVTVIEGVTISAGTVTISNGSILSTEDDPIVADGIDAHVTLGANLSLDTTGCAIAVKHRAKFYIDGADILSHSKYHAAVFAEGYGLASDNTYLALISGTITATDATAVSVAKRAVFELMGGKITSNVAEETPGDFATVYIKGPNAHMLMTGGEIYGKYIRALVVSDATAVTDGGRISTDSRHGSAVYATDNNTSFTLISGEIESSKSDDIVVNNEDGNNIHILIQGGTLIAGGTAAADNSKSCVVELQGDVKSNIVISEGRFKGELNFEYLAEGSTYYIDSDGYIVVTSTLQPEPQPEPEPEPQPQPEPDPEPTHHTFGGLIKKPTHVYGSPSMKFVVDDIIGAVLILQDGFIDDKHNEYTYIQYKLAGTGRTGKGYVISSTIDRGGDE